MVDDDADLRLVLGHVLRGDGFKVGEFRDGEMLLEHLRSTVLHGRPHERPALIVSDIRMTRATGFDIVRQLRSAGWLVPIILMTAFDDEATRAEARNLGVSSFLHKPFDLDDFRTAAVYLTSHGQQWRDQRSLNPLQPPQVSRGCRSCHVALVGARLCAECRHQARPHDALDRYDDVGGSG